MFSQKQMVEKGIEIGHWPTFERFPDGRKYRKHSIGDMVGMIYDTANWPVPDEVYHPDNYKEWHCDDPNVPPRTKEQKEEGRRVMEKWS